MRRARRILAALAATLLTAHGSACVIEGSLGKDSDVTTTTATETSTTQTGTGESGDSSSTTSVNTTHSSSSTSSTTHSSTGGETMHTTGGESTTDGGSTTGALPDACQPSPDDDDCTTCRKGHCCAELDECLMHVPCACMLECVDGGTDLPGCAIHCETDESILADFHACDVDSCGAVCPP